MFHADQGYEWCDIRPWYNEIVTRMHEANAAKTGFANLSYSHPRSYIPGQILRRPAIRALLQGWHYDNTRAPIQPPPPNIWLPTGWPSNTDLEHCSLKPFVDEIELRYVEATAINPVCPIVDETNWHPRGGIPHQIVIRLGRRKDPSWMKQMQTEVDRLLGLANKDESFALTQKDRIESVEDPSKLEASVRELKARAQQYRAQAKWLREEMG